MTDYLQVWISAEDTEQANTILNILLQKKLVTGGQMINAPARFWWKSEIVDMNYCSITTFTIKKHKQAIIDEVEKASIEEVPMISFVAFEGNKRFQTWVSKTVDE